MSDSQKGQQHTGSRYHSDQGDSTQVSMNVSSSSISTPLPESVVGAPSHLRAAIRRQQNMVAARRSRQNHEEQLRVLIEQCAANTAQVDALEQRIDVLVKVLEDAGIALPSNISDTLLDSLTAFDDQGGSAFKSETWIDCMKSSFEYSMTITTENSSIKSSVYF
eukprot:IDg10584t1